MKEDTYASGAGTGGAIFGRSVNPIPIGEGRLSPPITTGTPNVFHLPASLYAIEKWTGNPSILMLWILFSMWRFYRWTDKDAPWPKIEKKCHHIQSNKCILVHKVENLWDWKRPIFHKLQKRLSENATLVSAVPSRLESFMKSCPSFSFTYSKDTIYTKLALMPWIDDNLGHTLSVLTQIGNIIAKIFLKQFYFPLCYRFPP